MLRTWRAGRVLAMLSLAVIGASVLALPTDAQRAPSTKRPATSIDANSSEERLSITGSAAQRVEQGAVDPLQLRADDWNNTVAQLTPIPFNGKLAFGTRLTPTADQLPFTLRQAEVLVLQTQSGAGLKAGDPLEIVVAVDVSGSGNPDNATIVHRQDVTVTTSNALNLFQLSMPITVKQGDIYILFADRRPSTVAGGTLVILQDVEKGASSLRRSYLGLLGSLNDPSSYLLLEDTNDGEIQGNFIVRGYGVKAAADTPATGGGEPTNDALPKVPSVRALIAGSDIRLEITPPTIPAPNLTNATDTEPNDSPAAAQTLALNTTVAGNDRSTNPGAAGGLCDENGQNCDDIEDWYRITLTEASPLRVIVNGFGGQDFDVYIFREGGPFVGTNAIGQGINLPGIEEVVNFATLEAGTYLIAVSAYDDVQGPTNSNYVLTVTVPTDVQRYNVYCALGSDPTPTAAFFYGALSASETSFTVRNSPASARYVVTAVSGNRQSPPSDVVTGAPCTGGPVVMESQIKINKKGKSIKITGANIPAGTRIFIGDAGFVDPPTIKKGNLTQKGNLTNNQTINQAIPAGGRVTIRFETTGGGCSTVTYNRPPAQ